MDRRGFLRAFGMGGAGAAAAAAVASAGVAATGGLVRTVPEPMRANDVGEAGQVRMPPSLTEDSLESIKEGLRSLAMLAAAGIQSEIEMRRGRFRSMGFVVHKKPWVATARDIVVLPGGQRIALGRHMECTFQVPDLKSLIDKAAVMEMYMLPARIGLAEAIIEHCEGRSVLCYARLPLIEPGLGAIAARGEAPEVAIRAILSFSNCSLNHHITLDTLYGVA